MTSKRSTSGLVANFLGGVFQNIVAQVFLIIVVPVIVVVVAALISNVQMALQLLTIILILPVSIGALYSFYQRRAKDNSLKVRFVQDEATNTICLIDSRGVVKLSPDIDTLTYLLYLLGQTDGIPTVSQEYLTSLPWLMLTSVNTWRNARPKTPEELESQKAITAIRAIVHTELRFEKNSSPQRLIISLSNRSDKVVLISRAYFLPKTMSFSFGDISGSHKREGNFVILGENLSIAPQGVISIDLKFTKAWTVAQFERTRSEFGWLYVDASYDGMSAVGIIYQV